MQAILVAAQSVLPGLPTHSHKDPAACSQSSGSRDGLEALSVHQLSS